MIFRMMAFLAPIAALIALAPTPRPAAAAEAVFPLGSRIGLVPPPGFVQSKRLPGFENAETQSSIVLIGLPPQAFATIEATMSPEAVKSQGITEEKRESLTLPNGKALMVIGAENDGANKSRKWMFLGLIPEGTVVASVQVPEASRKTYSDETVRAALLTLTARPAVPVDEVLELLPFKITERSGMRPVHAIPGGGMFLTDGPKDAPLPSEQPVFVISIGQGGPEQTSDRANFARNMFTGLGDFKDVHIVSGDMLRLDNLQTHELQAEGKDAQTDIPVKLVQWVRFPPGGYIRMIGIARADQWRTLFPRFRAVRDGITLRE